MRLCGYSLEDTGLREDLRAILRKIDRKGHGFISGGQAWDESMFAFAFESEGLKDAERQLIIWWISAWRRRVREANASRS